MVDRYWYINGLGIYIGQPACVTNVSYIHAENITNPNTIIFKLGQLPTAKPLTSLGSTFESQMPNVGMSILAESLMAR